MNTKTCMGAIPHEKHPYADIMMPVKLVVVDRKLAERNKLPIPMMVGEKLVYALPGGGEYVL